MNEELKQVLKNQEVIMRILFNTPLSKEMNEPLGIQITKTIQILNPEESSSLQDQTKGALSEGILKEGEGK